MPLIDSDHADIGTLLAWALRPAQRPGRNPEYQRVLARYRTEHEFKSAADAVLYGLGAEPLSAGDFGLILGIAPESPLAFRVSDMPSVSKPRAPAPGWPGPHRPGRLRLPQRPGAGGGPGQARPCR
jgi:hypothetical protein